MTLFEQRSQGVQTRCGVLRFRGVFSLGFSEDIAFEALPCEGDLASCAHEQRLESGHVQRGDRIGSGDGVFGREHFEG